jgi:hypothetical protein
LSLRSDGMAYAKQQEISGLIFRLPIACNSPAKKVMSLYYRLSCCWLIGCNEKSTISYKNHHFPPQVIAYAAWLYFRFPLACGWSRKCCWSAASSSPLKRSGGEEGETEIVSTVGKVGDLLNLESLTRFLPAQAKAGPRDRLVGDFLLLMGLEPASRWFAFFHPFWISAKGIRATTQRDT